MITEFFPTGSDLRFTGGVEARTYFVAKDLAKKHEVHVICTKDPNSKREENIHGIYVHRVGPTVEYLKAASIVTLVPRLKFIVEAIKTGIEIDPDIVDGGNFSGHLIAKEIANRNRIPCVYWYPDVFIGQWVKSSGIIAGPPGFLLEKFNLLRKADFFIAISNATKQKLIKNGIPEEKISVIYCGVEKTEFQKKNDLSENRIICISRLVKYKRVKDLIMAFYLLSKKMSNITLVIIGRGNQEDELKQLVSTLQIERRVIFKSNLKRKELTEELQRSKILCLPSEIEGFGIVTIEAAALGKPYVVSDIPVLREITKDGKGGLIFKLGDVKDLQDKLESLLTIADLYNKKSQEALVLAKNYQWKDIANKTAELYQTLSNSYTLEY